MNLNDILLEYSRDKTAQNYGQKILDAFKDDRSVGGLYNVKLALRQRIESGSADREYLNDVLNEVLEEIESLDPTSNKEYSQWMARMYAVGNIWLEDLNGNNLLGLYDTAKKRRMLKPEDADINRFKSYRKFVVTMNDYDFSKLDDKKELKKGKSEEVYTDSDVRIIIPKDKESACYYGQNTQWCTAATKGTNYFDTYNKGGPLYILLPKMAKHTGEKYQLHFEPKQFMDETNEPIDLDFIFERFPGAKAYLTQHIKELAGNIRYASDELLQKLINGMKTLTIGYVEEYRQSTEQHISELKDLHPDITDDASKKIVDKLILSYKNELSLENYAIGAVGKFFDDYVSPSFIRDNMLKNGSGMQSFILRGSFAIEHFIKYNTGIIDSDVMPYIYNVLRTLRENYKTAFIKDTWEIQKYESS